MDWVDAGAADTLPPGERREVEVGKALVALLNLDGALYAIDNDCPHRGGPLAHGDLKGFLLHCPLHAWPFDVRTGQCSLFPSARVRVFDVRVHEGRIQIASEGRFIDAAPPKPR